MEAPDLRDWSTIKVGFSPFPDSSGRSRLSADWKKFEVFLTMTGHQVVLHLCRLMLQTTLAYLLL